eukprot:scaffold43924_cov61-Phaeocystis_antarctica.AAC.3
MTSGWASPRSPSAGKGVCALCLPGIPYGTALLPRLKRGVFRYLGEGHPAYFRSYNRSIIHDMFYHKWLYTTKDKWVARRHEARPPAAVAVNTLG